MVDHHLGNMAAITALIARQNAPILDVKFQNKTPEFYEISLELNVHSLEQLQNIIAVLRLSPHVISVERK
jgi:guanosine-3',5'-bis(diphosphate) 3'-pyrophosphohydrolase